VTLVSALVCTRNRPDDIGAAVRSLLAGDDGELELIVIDQSDDGKTEAALAGLTGDRRLRYVRSSSRGKGAALNEGLRIARGDILVCTDDDCEAPPNWAIAMGRTLESQPTAAVAFCNVVAPPHDRSAGYVPAYERQSSRLVRSIGATIAGHGLGAGMALRRKIILDLGGFDESLGPGSRFPSGDDWDITARALLRGWHVYETADIAIVHHGFRTLEQGRKHARRDWIAIGAVCAKPLRAGHWNALIVPLWEFSAHAMWPPLADALRLRRPRGLSRIAGFVEGFAAGLRTPVNRETLIFERQP
jgi:glycosyltransferase involved in cell wall biosynthesis